MAFPTRVTAIKALAGALVIFTIDSAYYIEGPQLFGNVVLFPYKEITGSSGCISHKAAKKVENDIYYVTPQKEIKSVKRSLSGDEQLIITPLSKKIQPFLNLDIGANIADTFMVYNDILKEVYVHFRLTGGVFNILRVVGDLNKVDGSGNPAWYIDGNMPFYCGVQYQGQTYYGSITTGQVFADNQGLADVGTANIQTSRVSPDYDLNNPTVVKTFSEFAWFGEINLNADMLIDIYVDGLLVKTSSITSVEIPSLAVAIGASGGGIGTQAIATYGIGEEEGESASSSSSTDTFEIVKRIPLRARGRKLSYVLRSDSSVTFYRGRFIQIGFIASGRLVNPIIEK